MSKKIRPGTFTEEIPEEKILWRDRKRLMFLGLPWSFTRYDLTATKLRISRGFFKRVEDDVLLYRITDVTFYQTFAERLNGLGTLCIISSDVSQPEAHIVHVKKPHKVKVLLLRKIEAARKEKGVYASELIGGIAHARPPINHADQSEHEQSNPRQEREQHNAEHNH